ncbi:MAG: (Fe-S)-binding protein [Spirochaetia bacterium]|nr:(Fe-S)-binding protein [Spirochaetia bacterium]
MDIVNLSGLQVVLFISFFTGAMGYAVYVILHHWKMAHLAQSFTTNTPIIEKIKSVLFNVLLQKKVMKKPVRGIFHVFVFFGFFAYSLHTMSQFVAGFTGNYSFYIPELFGDVFLSFYENLLDVFSLLVLAGVCFFFIRRYFFRAPELDRPSFQSIIILSLISLLMIFTFLETSAKGLLKGNTEVTLWRSFLIDFIPNYESSKIIFQTGWWGHVLTVLIFLMYVPGSKHAHLFWAPVNFWFKSDSKPGKMPDLDIENSTVWGAGNVHEFTWKNYLDALSCIECGRCQLACPASRTGKLLSPKKIMTDLKHVLNEKMPVYEKQVRDGKTAQEIVESGDCRVIDNYFLRDELWSCTSCYACVETCPVGNNQLEPILQMRRSVVLNEGAMPPQLQNALTNIENQSNPWGISSDEREKWTEGLNISTMRDLKANGQTPEVLYWVGCAGAFDDRNKKIARTFSELLKKADVTFGILGIEESCTGDSARRAGNEYLFQSLAAANIEILNNYGVNKIVTACPHCLNTLKNEYPAFGGNYEVIHHSEYISKLIQDGRLKVDSSNEISQGLVSYHDSCYLGRHNGNYEHPRNLISTAGNSLAEASECKEQGMCCGAGGAQMWMEEMGSERINIARTRQLVSTGSKTLATACPFCITMIGDGVKSEGLSDSHKVLDIVEIVADRLKKST